MDTTAKKIKKSCFILGREASSLEYRLLEWNPEVHIRERFPFGFFFDVPDEIGFKQPSPLPEFCIHGDWELPHQLMFDLFIQQKISCVFIESCTGGLCSAKLTDIDGSSQIFWGGWIVYSNEAKVRLGVRKGTIEKWGAVSKQTVLELAAAGRINSGADWSVSISGIAGPAGGSPEKPVGTVWMGIEGVKGSWAFRFQFSGDRCQVREKASAAAFLLLMKFACRK
jgi:PncC family amidohydrolase